MPAAAATAFNGEGHGDTDDQDVGSAPTVIFKDLWRRKETRIKGASSLGQVAKEWRLMPIIGEAGMSREGKSAFPSCKHADENEIRRREGGRKRFCCCCAPPRSFPPCSHFFYWNLSLSTRHFFFYESLQIYLIKRLKTPTSQRTLPHHILPQERYQLVSDQSPQCLPCATQMRTRR